MSIYNHLLDKTKAISVTGLGYVGLPLALEFAKHFRVIGFDISEERVALMKQGIDPSKELESNAFDGTDILFTTNPEDLKKAHFHIIGVPTDIDEHKVPNLRPLLSASKSIGRALKPEDFVVYESTVYPGCTEEDCLPILEKESGLQLSPSGGVCTELVEVGRAERGGGKTTQQLNISTTQHFSLGYSPERINPGDKERTLTKILKIVSGHSNESLMEIAKVYDHIIEAGVYRASSIKVAEAAKVIENTQRDINIALMNELAMIFDKMGIDTKSVLEAAGTKWNFLNFSPGLVGGHCIGVDPYYLTYKSQKLGHIPNMILSGRKTNEIIPAFVAKRLIQHLIRAGKNPGDCRVLIKGFTFKENVADVRNTKVINVLREIESFDVSVDVVDSWASAEEIMHEYNIELLTEPAGKYDAVIVAVMHNEYKELKDHDFANLMTDKPILFDLKGFYKPMKNLVYWRL